ncbi:hypothetical protein NPIL_593021 [Nephila pilipes]|uniref:Activating transcription factor 7-interacting protein Fn3 domain-containing protein n=1 Tax=Nephila pilipes TaxID=299642 RepID=A0A8X6TD70_NEPPI|nr:hypothetical protein NPIL_593021 [Nephila pilipes]
MVGEYATFNLMESVLQHWEKPGDGQFLSFTDISNINEDYRNMLYWHNKSFKEQYHILSKETRDEPYSIASAEVSVDFPIDLEAFRYYAEKYKFSKGQKLIVDLSDEKILTSSIKYATNTASKSPPVKITQEPDSEPSYTVSSATEINPQSVLDPNVKVKVECIDLTDETPSKTDEAPVTIVKTPVKIVKTPVKIVKTPVKIVKKPAKIVETPMQPKPSCSRVIAHAVGKLRHPAPLPPKPFTFCNKYLPSSPPKPSLSVCVAATGIILKWEMPLYAPAYTYAKFDSYELFWYEELQNMPVDSQLWKRLWIFINGMETSAILSVLFIRKKNSKKYPTSQSSCILKCILFLIMIHLKYVS